ncbi:MAG: GDP-L-fucose synthase [Terrimicrobiaceae bacterium]
MFSLDGRKVFVAGHRGMVGSAVCRALDGRTEVLTRSRSEGLDLCDRKAVREFFESERPSVVVDAAAKVGGIAANKSQPVEFFLQNVTIQNNLIEAAADFGVEKFLFLGSSCIYPKMAPQPIPESALLTGPLEPTNEAYAIAKISGIRLCQYYARQYGKCFLSAMPTNLYGPHDNFDLETSHVLPALIRKFHEARLAGDPEVTVWGTGTPRREFLHVDDLASACIFLLENYDSPEIVNVGCGEDVTIAELADIIKEITGFTGRIVFDPSRPDGTPRKLMDISRLSSLGWKASIPLKEGIRHAYNWFISGKY